MASKRTAARARALVGVRFRPQGRDPAKGLDCVGVVIHAFRLEAGSIPDDYRLSSLGRTAELMAGILARFAPLRRAEVGHLVVMEAGRRQMHLGVRTEAGIVHADARTGRVIEGPIPPGARVVGYFRRRRRCGAVAGSSN